jgi:hypothetical protein
MFIPNQRIASATLLGALVGLRFHHTWSQERILGREAYLVHQGQHFDKFLAVPHSMLGSIFGGLFVVAVIVGVYELVSAGISKVLGNSSGPK